jgi:hypothetical protein
MPLLRMRDATFASGASSVGPLTLNLEQGGRAALVCASPKEAAIVALLATGIVKASGGSVLIGDFDPRVQPVHCKRIAALVPHEPFALDEQEFERYLQYRAALWSVETPRALAQARLLRERLAGMHEAFAYPLLAAMVGMPRLVILDRPQPVYAEQILRATAGSALFSTHADAAAASAFA